MTAVAAADIAEVEDDAVGHDRARQISLLLVLAALAVLVWCAWNRRWMSDDGFIYLRVVQNVRAGHGPVFNAGERVEAATGPAWVVLLSIFDLVSPLRLEWTAMVLGIACAVGGCAYVARGAAVLRRDVLRDRALLVPFGLAIVVAIPAVWDYATSGLETGLALSYIGAAFFVMVRLVAHADWQRSVVPFRTAIVVSLGPLVRPDLLLFLIAFGAVLLLPRVGERPLRHRARVVAVVLGLPAAYEIFRAGYYGALVPNTAFAKEGSTFRLHQGFRYAWDFLDSYWLWLPLLLVAVALVLLVRALRRTQASGATAVVVACVAAGLVDAAYTIAIGGSHMHARLFLPSLLAVVAPVAVVPWHQFRAGLVVALGWSVLCAAALRSPPMSPSAPILPPAMRHYGIIDLRSFFTVSTHHDNPISVASHLDGIDPAFRVVTATPRGRVSNPAGLVGAVAYDLGPSVYVFDNLGLGDWLTSRLPLHREWFPDHQKYTGEWLSARLSEVGGTPPPRDAATVAAMHALTCGDLRELRASATDDLTVGRFFSNMWDAVKLNSFRLPNDPRDAERSLCGK